MKKILIQIFGIEDEIIDECENCMKRCSGCRKCCINHDCGSIKKTNNKKNMWETYEDMAAFIKSSEIGENAVMEFIDIKRDGLQNYNNVQKLLLEGYKIPLTVIDGIVRYYGGISKKLIYEDVKELLK